MGALVVIPKLVDVESVAYHQRRPDLPANGTTDTRSNAEARSFPADTRV